jgi:hypothetical protein
LAYNVNAFPLPGNLNLFYIIIMVTQKDLFRSAQELIKQHGNDAEELAIGKWQILLASDDVKAAGVWFLIAQAINDLNSMEQQGNLH